MGARNGLVFNIGPHIKSDASRAATYSKRKKGLLKKVKELSILCGVDVAVMCHHPHMAGAPPLLWGQPNLDSVLSRYKGVAPEEREKRKLDNTTFLHNQVQKLTADLQHIVDHNRKLEDHLENSLWDDRLNSFSAVELQQVAVQVQRKKKEVADLLAVSSSSAAGGGGGGGGEGGGGGGGDGGGGGGGECNQLMQNFDHLTGVDSAGYMCAASSGFVLQSAHNDVLPGQDLLRQQLFCRMQAFGSSDCNAPMAAYLQPNVMGAAIPNAALCLTPPGAKMDGAAESENSIVSGPNAEPEMARASSGLVNLDVQSMFAARALGAVDALDDEFGPMSMDSEPVDMAPPWFYSTGMATTSPASDASDTYSVDAAAAAQSHDEMPTFTTEVYDYWTDGISFAIPPEFVQCQPNQSLQPEAVLLVPHVN